MKIKIPDLYRILQYFARFVLIHAIPRHDHLLLHKCSCHTWKKTRLGLYSPCHHILSGFHTILTMTSFLLFSMASALWWVHAYSLGEWNRRYEQGDSEPAIPIVGDCDCILSIRGHSFSSPVLSFVFQFLCLWLTDWFKNILEGVIIFIFLFSLIFSKLWPHPCNSRHRNSSYLAVKWSWKTRSLLWKTQNENSDVSIQGRLCFHMDE